MRNLLIVLSALGLSGRGEAQITTIPFTSGPIPLCDTSTFTANVSGIGVLSPPGNFWSVYLQSLTINITTDHPQTLRIFLTSPGGTQLLLSQYNGAGGQNYTNTTFAYDGWSSITTGSAPFTGTWSAQGGSFSVFDYQFADGPWTITVIDTACTAGGAGPGGTWTPGWFDGSSSGGFAFAFTGPPPCWGGIPDNTTYLCPGESVDVLGYYENFMPGYEYTIWDVSGMSIPDPTVISDPGWYGIQAIDPWMGCWYGATYTVIASPQIALGPDQTVDQCSNAGPTNLSALFPLTGVTPVWSLDGTGITMANAASASTPGTYRLIGQNEGGCNDTAFVTLSVLPAPALGADQPVNICPGGSVDLTALYDVSGLSAVWRFNGTDFLTPTAATDAGVYTLIATNADGCSDQANVTLNVQATSSLGADQNVDLCSNAAVDLSSLYATAGMTTTWTLMGVPVSNPGSITSAGTYRLVASNGGSCADTAFVSVNGIASPTLGADAAATLCVGDAIDLTTLFATTGLGTAWTSSGSPVPDPTAVGAAGVYTLVATNAGGCWDTALVTLNSAAGPALGADQVANVCPGVGIDLTTLYDLTGLTAAWRFGGADFLTPAAASDAGVYTLIATNASGCADSAQVTIALQVPPALGADQGIDLCGNASFDLTSLYTTTGLVASWTLMDDPVADPASITSAGTYRLVGLNSAGCADTAFVLVNGIAPPALGADVAATVCAGNAIDLTALFPATGLGTVWTSSGSLIADPAAVDAAGLYMLVATGATGCRDTAQVSLGISANPVLGPDQVVTACEGTAMDLTSLYATGVDATAWTQNGVPMDPLAVASSGTYTLVVTNAAGCTATAAVTVDLDPAPALGADRSASICAGSTFDLTSLYATAGLASAWTLEGTVEADPSAVTMAGDHQLVVTNDFGCSDTAVVSLTVNPGPSLGEDLLFTLCPWQTVDLSTAFATSGMISSYTLNGQPVEDPTTASDTGTYVITVTDQNGCTDVAMASIMAGECLCVADLKSNAHCMQDPVQFTLLADSTVLDARWDLNGIITTEIDPVMRFTSEGSVLVTLQATLSCGVVNVQRTIQLQDCADSCTVYIPAAFTPDGDTWNDSWVWSGPCEPEEFSVQVFNRFGEMIFASSDPRGSWDGTYKGVSSPSGVYAYRVGYRLPYQDRKEVTGSITLLR